jgi:glutathione S-transferase
VTIRRSVRLVLHQHPFASYCQKALVALGELGLPFETHLVDDADASERVIEDARRFREVFPLPSPDDADAHRPSAA